MAKRARRDNLERPGSGEPPERRERQFSLLRSIQRVALFRRSRAREHARPGIRREICKISIVASRARSIRSLFDGAVSREKNSDARARIPMCRAKLIVLIQNQYLMQLTLYARNNKDYAGDFRIKSMSVRKRF